MKFKDYEKEIELSENQKKIAKCDKQIIVAACGRRFGKEIVAAKMAWDEIQEPYTRILWVMPTNDMIKKIWLDGILPLLPENKIEPANYVKNYVRFTNGSAISLESEDNLKKYSISELKHYDFIILDECAFMKEDVWTKVEESNTKTLLISTPKGYNWFYKVFQESKADSKNRAAFQFTSEEGGFIEKSAIKDAEDCMSDKMFQQEFLAKFVDLNGEIDKQDEEKALAKYFGEYTKKPVKIEAVLYDGSTESLIALNSSKFGLDPLKVKVSKDETEKDKIIIPTLEGDLTASVGDYIIKGVNGEFYHCKPDIFAKTYEVAEK